MKKTFRLSILLAVLTSMVSTKAFAYDIAMENEDGVTIYYNYSGNGSQLIVTYRDQHNASYSGNVVIPEQVTYMSKTRMVTSIGDGAFNQCRNLTSVTIPNSVTSIGSHAFEYCTSLTSVTIPESVTSIGDRAFYYTGWYYNQNDGLLYLGNWLLGYKGNIGDMIIINDTKRIANRAFAGCTSITSVTIGNSVTSIGGEAFEGCSGLTSVTIGNGVTSIGGDAFYNCYNLTSVTIGNNVKSIEFSTFEGCRSLTSVTIPNSVQFIRENAFSNCTNLISLTIGNGVKCIEMNAFGNCFNLTKVIVKDIAAWCGIGFDDNPLWYAHHLYSDENTEITDLVIPNSVTSIGYKAFYGCNSFTSVYSQIDNPFYIDYYTFSEDTYNNATLYVPGGAVDKYKATESWNRFLHIVAPGADKCATPTISYANKRLTFDCETEGVEFVSKITDTDIGSFSSSNINLSATYNISVYATKSGMYDSEVATATLVWIEAEFTTNESSGVKPMQAAPVLIQANDGQISVEGAPEGTRVAVYDMNGMELGAAISRGGNTMVRTHMSKGSVAVVKIGERAVKVLMK